MKYEDYDIEHFITDEFFIQWIKNPNENNSHFWEKWILQHPEKRALVNKAAQIIRSIKSPDIPLFTDRMYVDIFEQIMRADITDRPKPETITKKFNTQNDNFFSFVTLRGIAAGIMILFCIWAQYEAVKSTPTPIEIAEAVIIKRTNPAGQKSIIDLPDGTRIHLNSQSVIEFPKNFTSDLRLVKLQGEAFFEVVKESRPFLVESGDAKIQVLGTSFNVNQREDGALNVALISGKVRVNTENGSNLTLNPNEMLVLEKGGAIHKTGFDENAIIGWKNNILVFKSSKLPETINKLENWFGVKVILEGHFANNWTYTGTYKDETLENVLRGICTTSGMSYKIDKKQIILTKN